MYAFQDYTKKLEYYCSYQERCHQEVVQKLYALKCPTHWHDEVIVHLINHNFLNQERFAKLYAISKWNQKKWGKLKIQNALKQKNISEKLIQTALSEIDADEYSTYLMQLINKYQQEISETNAYKKQQKILQKIQQKGFEINLALDFF